MPEQNARSAEHAVVVRAAMGQQLQRRLERRTLQSHLWPGVTENSAHALGEVLANAGGAAGQGPREIAKTPSCAVQPHAAHPIELNLPGAQLAAAEDAAALLGTLLQHATGLRVGVDSIPAQNAIDMARAPLAQRAQEPVIVEGAAVG